MLGLKCCYHFAGVCFAGEAWFLALAVSGTNIMLRSVGKTGLCMYIDLHETRKSKYSIMAFGTATIVRKSQLSHSGDHPVIEV